MAPARGTKRKSDESVSAGDGVEDAHDITQQRLVADTDSSSQETPRKRQRTGISIGQKQALIDNLQLEITERARKLRAQYNLQAQGLRTRIEIRVNRIPMALRKTNMGELADKYRNGQHPQLSKPTPSLSLLKSARPEKDTSLARPPSSRSIASDATAAYRPGPGRPPKDTSDSISSKSKENIAGKSESESPKKKKRNDMPKDSKVLSPASTNVRTLPRTTPAGKALFGKSTTAPENAAGPSKSPMKQLSASNLLSNWADKARSTRTAVTGKKFNASTSSKASSASSGSLRGKKPAAGSKTATTSTTSAASTKTQRRISGISESSEGSTSTVVKKTDSKGSVTSKKAAPAPASKRGGVIGSIRRGVTGAGAKKAATAKAAPASTATGRVLRSRN